MAHEKALAALLSKKAPKAAARTVSALDFSGTWQNEYGSTAQFVVSGSNVSGTYTSQVSGSNQTITGPIVGQVTGDVIGFTVLWPTPDPSLTAWAGQLVDDGGNETLETLWYLVMDVSDDPNQLWKSTLAGADFFVRV
jgi:hypothetical protein